MKTKLEVFKIKYKVDKENRVIICIITCGTNMISTPPYIMEIYREKVMPKLNMCNAFGVFTISAKSRCHIDDEWDEIKGKRIAESKATKKAFKIALRIWCLLTQELNKASNLTDELFFANYNAYIRECEHLKKLSE